MQIQLDICVPVLLPIKVGICRFLTFETQEHLDISGLDIGMLDWDKNMGSAMGVLVLGSAPGLFIVVISKLGDNLVCI